MSTTEIQQVVSALSATQPVTPLQDKPLQRITVLGGGADGCALACLCLAAGCEVTLFSAYAGDLRPLRERGAITVRGTGPVGTYQIGQEDVPSIHLTSSLDEAVIAADAIFVTGPVLKQRTYAMVLAGHLRDEQTVVIAPGRTLGAVETAWYLRVGGNTSDISIVELQALPFWVEERDTTLRLSVSGPVTAAVLPSGRSTVLRALKNLIPDLVPVASVLHSGLGDASGLIETVALTLGGPALGDGLVDLPPGAEPLSERRVFRTLLGDRHTRIVSALAAERRAVAARWGVRNLPGTDEWLDHFAGTLSGEGVRPLPAHEQADHLIRCATMGSLVPLKSAAEVAGIPVPATTAMIELAHQNIGGDLLNAGRRLDTMGFAGAKLDEVRRQLDELTVAG
tara:strand:- start:2585 stop:3772 length:1188 start_codon:yes stop_codon:yes gene_type:complete